MAGRRRNPRRNRASNEENVRIRTRQGSESPTEAIDEGRWTAHHGSNYKAMKTVAMEPTRFASLDTLGSLSIREDVESFFDHLGMGNFFALRQPLYPRLAQEFLATCNITYRNPHVPVAEEGTLTFFLKRQFYAISLNELCSAYGFPHHSDTSLPRMPQAQEIWDIIASGEYTPRTAKIALIRNPAIRIAVKIISNTLFFKAESAAVREDELWLIFYAIKHLVPHIAGPERYNVNLGGVLAELLTKIKTTAPRSRKPLYCGTILTPLFHYLNLDLSEDDRVDNVISVDMTYLIRCRIMIDEHTYGFYDKDGNHRQIQLPNPAATALTSLENVEFLPPAQAGNLRPRRSMHERPRRTEFEAAPRCSEHIQRPRPDREEQRRDDYPFADFDPAKFELNAMPSPADELASRQWIMESTCTNNALLRRMWSAITRMGCFSGNSRRRTRSPAAWERPIPPPSPPPEDQIAEDSGSNRSTEF